MKPDIVPNSVVALQDHCSYKVPSRNRGAARNFVRVGPVTDVVKFQTLAILHKYHFDVTGQFLVYCNTI